MTIERYQLLQFGFLSIPFISVIALIPVTVAVIVFLPKMIIKEHIAHCAKFMGVTETTTHVALSEPAGRFKLDVFSVLMITSSLALIIMRCLSEIFSEMSPETKMLMLAFYFSLIAIALIDYSNFLIPEEISIPLILAGLFVSASNYIPTQLADAVYGLIVPGLFAVGIWVLHRLLNLIGLAKGTPLIGTGDYYLFSACGVWLGLSNLKYLVCFMLLFSVIFAIIFKTRKIPLGVPVLLAAVALLFKHA
ncbi:prepilin peptidase [Serratia symbiotica]|uniref:prepilin peptidase n=1 Tax=Serratia symbiotica TaxID=138074 RepID=UPI00136B9588|nr:prepilin peptidase [Serratia symbiotica]QTP13348.1 prepilin peptidase [Serratia symbiotica]